MHRLRLLVVAGALIAIGQLVTGQEKPKDGKDTKAPPAKLKGQLPQNWGKLGLSDEQKQKVYATKAKYKTQTEELMKKLEDLKDKEKKDLEEILTKDQQAKLIEILTGKAPAEPKPKD